MPAVFVGPGTLFLGDSSANADPYSCDVTEARVSDVSPTYSEVTGCGTQSAAGSADLEMTVSVVQDIGDPESLLRKSWTLHNTIQKFWFIPNRNGAALSDVSSSTPALAGEVLVTRLDVGGNATSLATASKTWKVQGNVTLIETPPVVTADAA